MNSGLCEQRVQTLGLTAFLDARVPVHCKKKPLKKRSYHVIFQITDLRWSEALKLITWRVRGIHVALETRHSYDPSLISR